MYIRGLHLALKVMHRIIHKVVECGQGKQNKIWLLFQALGTLYRTSLIYCTDLCNIVVDLTKKCLRELMPFGKQSLCIISIEKTR